MKPPQVCNPLIDQSLSPDCPSGNKMQIDARQSAPIPCFQKKMLPATAKMMKKRRNAPKKSDARIATAPSRSPVIAGQEFGGTGCERLNSSALPANLSLAHT